MAINPDTIAINLRNLREKHKMNQEQFASELNVARPTISNWEKGKVLPTSEQLFTIASTFGVSIDALVGLNLTTKTWVIPDTSVLVDRPRIINELCRRFTYVVISQTVVGELNGLKDHNIHRSKQARLAMNTISGENKKEGSNLKIYGDVSNKPVNDDRIIDLAADIAKKHPEDKIYVLNKDVYFSCQKDLPGVKFQSLFDYDKMFTDENTPFDLGASTEFYTAVKGKSVEKATKRYEKGMVDPNRLNIETGFSPLIVAVRNRDYKMVNYLLSIPDIDINKRDDKKYCLPPISHAIQMDDITMVRILIDAGCDVNCGSRGKNFGNSPLMIAGWHGRTEIAKVLMEADACLNQQDANGFTPLIKACINEHVETAKLLMPGTDQSIRDREEKNAMDWAYCSKNAELKKLFTEGVRE